MEFAIALGIGFTGYILSDKTPVKRQRQLPPPDDVVWEPIPPVPNTHVKRKTVDDLYKEHEETIRRRWQQSRTPDTTGIVNPAFMRSHTPFEASGAMFFPKIQKSDAPRPWNDLPYFTSARTQNTNTGVKQRMLETFTGANTLGESVTGTYRKKKEVPRMFDLVGSRVTSSGGSNSVPDLRDQLNRVQTPGLKNNVSPTEKIYVGRGVGVGPDVTASDGFHPMFRIIPANVNEYKLTQLPGKVNHGFAPVSKRTSESETTVKSTVRFVENWAPAPGRATYTASTVRPELSKTITGKSHEPWMPAGASVVPVGDEDRGDAFYAFKDDNAIGMLPMTNATNATTLAAGAYVADPSDPKATQRGQVQTYSGMTSGELAVRGSNYDIALGTEHMAPPTLRDIHTFHTVGRNSAYENAGELRHEHAPPVTMKELILSPSEPMNVTGMQQMPMQSLVRRPNDKQPKRKVVGYTPPGGRMNVVARISKGYIKKKPVENIPLGHGSHASVHYAQQGKLTSTLNKLNPENQRITQYMPAKSFLRKPPEVSTRDIEPSRIRFDP